MRKKYQTRNIYRNMGEWTKKRWCSSWRRTKRATERLLKWDGNSRADRLTMEKTCCCRFYCISVGVAWSHSKDCSTPKSFICSAEAERTASAHQNGQQINKTKKKITSNIDLKTTKKYIKKQQRQKGDERLYKVCMEGLLRLPDCMNKSDFTFCRPNDWKEREPCTMRQQPTYIV